VSQALHIFRKDLRRGWPLLLLWFAILASWVAQSWRDPLLNDRLQQPTNLPSVIGIAALIGLSLLVHQEPLVGRNAFWLSRPIRPSALLGSKAGFVALFLLAPTLAGQFAVLLHFGLYREQWIPAFIEAGVPWLAILLVGFGLAALTPNTPVFVMTCLTVWAALLVSKRALVQAADAAEHNSEDFLWFLFGVGAVAIAASAAVVANQYLTRCTTVSIAIAAVGALAAARFPTGLGGAVQRVIEGAAAMGTIRVELRPGGQRERFSASRPVPLSRGGMSIWATAWPQGLPAGHDLELIGLQGQITWRDNAATSFASVRSWFAQEGVQDGSGGMAWFGGRAVGRIHYGLRVPGAGPFEEFLTRTGSLHTEARARLWRIEPAARIPLEAGARAEGFGWAVVLQQVQIDDGRLRTRYRLRRLETMAWPSRTPKLVVANGERGEMIAPGMVIPVGHEDFGELAAGPSVQVEETEITFPLEFRRPNGTAIVADEKWLDDAELLFLEYVPAGRLTALVDIGELTLEEQRRPRPQAVTELR
jgi:hypothetical protein